jgi:hypothetical protein
VTPEKFQMFENRLLKNYKHRLKQVKRLNLTCWRLYDHDLPEFPICVEFYEEYIYIAEYNRRHALTEEEHAAWFETTKEIISKMTGIPLDHMFVKLRKRMSHREGQYEKEEVTESKIITVQENGHNFLVNLTDYLDTGLFLDHRITREMVAAEANDKNFLNLLKYTNRPTIKSFKFEEGGTLGAGSFAKGGVTFDDKVKSIKKRLEGMSVAPKFRKEYGKTYDKTEALSAAKKIAGKMKAKEMSKKKS